MEKTDKDKVFVVIPAHNEEKNIVEVISRTRKFIDNIIVVEDGSSDSTRNLAKEAGAVVLSHIVNMGKGAALKTGCDYALSKGAEIMIAVDADCQHDPEEIPNFLGKIREGKGIVFGYRRFNKDMPLILRLGNKIISTTANILYHIRLYDTQCGYKAYTREAYKKIRWSSDDYSMESEIVAKVGRYHLEYSQIPIKTVYSDRYKGTTILDGGKIVINMIFWWFRFVI